MSTLIESYVETINALPSGDINALLREVYAEDVTFIDPAHKVEGLTNLINYFSKLYQNTNSCTFFVSNIIAEQQQYSLQWNMTLSHKSLQKGAPITVNGASFLHYDNNKIVLHQDYFDIGEMLYENVPVLGSVVKLIKSKL